MSDPDRRMGIAYGAAQNESDRFAKRVAVLIGPEGRIVEVHPTVNAKTYPHEQLESIQISAKL